MLDRHIKMSDGKNATKLFPTMTPEFPSLIIIIEFLQTGVGSIYFKTARKLQQNCMILTLSILTPIGTSQDLREAGQIIFTLFSGMYVFLCNDQKAL